MPDRLTQLTPKEFVRALERLGFIQRRQTGSHVIMRHPETKGNPAFFINFRCGKAVEDQPLDVIFEVLYTTIALKSGHMK